MDEPEVTVDPRVAAALRGLEDPATRTRTDWTRLEERVRWTAQAPLRALRRGERWWEEAAHWARAVVPLAVAAGLGALLLIARLDVGADATGPVLASESPSFYGALGNSDSERQLMDVTLGDLRPDLAVGDPDSP